MASALRGSVVAWLVEYAADFSCGSFAELTCILGTKGVNFSILAETEGALRSHAIHRTFGLKAKHTDEQKNDSFRAKTTCP